jgi:ubiquinone/menaquinone biosynthesis C-methylase UbiE
MWKGEPTLKPDFGETAGDYAAHRAGFPDSFFDRLAAVGIGRRGQCLVDLGTGTGSMAFGFAARGCYVIGIDLSEPMLKEARKLSASSGWSVEFRDATAEQTGLPDATADVVTAGQCWHWFNRPAVLREAARILKESGVLVIAHFDWLPLPENVVEATEALIRRHNPAWNLFGGCGLYPLWLRDLGEAGFQGIETFSYDVPVRYSPESWRGRVRASAGIGGSLPPEKVAVFDRDLAELLRERFPGEQLPIPHRVFAALAWPPRRQDDRIGLIGVANPLRGTPATARDGVVDAARDSHYLHGTAPEEQERLARLNDLLNDGALREMALGGGEMVLDVGCGLGQLARDIARRVRPRGAVIGVERSTEQLAQARRLADRAGEGGLVEFREGEATRVPLQEKEWGTFDIAHARYLLEHVPDPVAVVREMVRAVRPGGRIVLEDDAHDIHRLWPEPPGFSRLWSAYMRTYDRAGSDACVGHSLVSLLVQAGAIPRRNTWLFFGACAGQPELLGAYVDNLAGVLESARESILGIGDFDRRFFEECVGAVRAWGRRTDAAYWYAVSWAEGDRPVAL